MPGFGPRAEDPYVLTLAVLFVIEAAWLGWAPRSREDWALENALVVAWTGRSLAELTRSSRNHFDRFVHLAYGLLLTVPAGEVLTAALRPPAAWRLLLPVTLTMVGSMLYELVEWGAAMLFGGELGLAYVGAQGDVWDAQKDMALATLGALATGPAMAFLSRRSPGRPTSRSRARPAADATRRDGTAP